MNNIYRRFWFEFDIEKAFNFLPRIGYGWGITVMDYNDAVKIMDEKIFSKIERPTFKKVIENVDICELDQGHVIPNMNPTLYRGIWFHIGYD